jgi:glycosyltransferase involved in cell wall biosynthesis
MSFGIPVVASNIGGIPELVKNGITGYLFQPKNHHTLAYQLLEILGDSTIKKAMVDNCMFVYNERHRPVKHYSNLVNIYLKTIDSYEN